MLYAATIFLSSFLLFLVQPLIARLILPWFGGSAAVWTTCMLFFQALLLAGYAYAHLLTRYSRGRFQALMHTALLAVALATLPIAPSDVWKPLGNEEPVTRSCSLLGASVGLPYFLLAANSPLLQAWFARARPGENPYRLFAVSNLGSLIALLGYPFLRRALPRRRGPGEPVVVAVRRLRGAVRRGGLADAEAAGGRGRRPTTIAPISRTDSLLWLALSATGSVLLLAVTNHLTQNVAVGAAALAGAADALPRELHHHLRGRGLVPARVAVVSTAGRGSAPWAGCWSTSDFQFDLTLQLAIFLPGLFLGCLFCHGELYRLRPAPSRLTAFYLAVSAGGALGGLLVAVVAPLVFNGYYELGVGLVVLALLAAVRFAGLNAWCALRRASRCWSASPPARPTTASATSATCASPRAASTACCG